MTQWFEKKPGLPPTAPEGEGEVCIIGDTLPDWVRTPKELGSRQVRVLKGTRDKCPKCNAVVLHLHLENGLHVAECPTHGFLWYLVKSETH